MIKQFQLYKYPEAKGEYNLPLEMLICRFWDNGGRELYLKRQGQVNENQWLKAYLMDIVDKAEISFDEVNQEINVNNKSK